MYCQLTKQEDPLLRLESLLSSTESNFSRRFLDIVRRIQDNIDITLLAQLIESGRIQEAIEEVTIALSRFADVVVAGTIAVGANTAASLLEDFSVNISFDQTNRNAVEAIRNSRLRLITGLVQNQRDAIREVLTEGIRSGINPRQQAVGVRSAIGLTQRQVQTVQRYRQALERGSLDSLSRKLRDKRFDSTVLRSIRDNIPLDSNQIDRMVTRYEERQLKFRSEVIARTEALRSVHQGDELAFSQAIEEGRIDPNRLINTWSTSRDTRVRESHNGMNGQTRNYGEPFISDAGNALRYPGDEKAPGSETIQCRCLVTRRLAPISSIV